MSICINVWRCLIVQFHFVRYIFVVSIHPEYEYLLKLTSCNFLDSRKLAEDLARHSRAHSKKHEDRRT
jgi:hypothetical protein